MSKIDMTQEPEAAQKNALLSLLVTACQTDGWAVLVLHNGETVDCIAGLLTDELRIKIADAVRRTDASRGLMRYCGHCGYDVALAADDHCADCGGVTHDTRAAADRASLDMVSVERVHDLLERIDEYAMPGSSQEALIRESRTHTAVLMGIPPPVYDDDDEEAQHEAEEAQRKYAAWQKRHPRATGDISYDEDLAMRQGEVSK